MNYKLSFDIRDPQTNQLKSINNCDVDFVYDEKDYGNGYFVNIHNDDFSMDYCFDLRYNQDFNSKRKMAWIVNWVQSFWSGERRSWKAERICVWEVK